MRPQWGKKRLSLEKPPSQGRTLITRRNSKGEIPLLGPGTGNPLPSVKEPLKGKRPGGKKKGSKPWRVKLTKVKN